MRMRVVAALSSLVILGCHPSASSESQQSRAASGDETRTTQAPVAAADQACCSRCPLALPGVQLKYAQATGGGSLLFTGPEAGLEELRERVRELAAIHNREGSRLAMITMPHQASAEALDNGAQLLLTTPVNNDVPALQQEIEKEVQWMQGGHCLGAGALECECRQDVDRPLSSSASSEATPPADH
jgi:hypothetical protein